MASLIRGTDKEREEKTSKPEKEAQETSKTHGSLSSQRQAGDTEHGSTSIDLDVRAATFLDVATLRCLFVPQWQEEGVFWALQFLYHRSVVLLRVLLKFLSNI